MHVFLSYSASDHKLAERLCHELSRAGLSISAFDPQERAGVDWRKQVQPRIRSADDILILVGSNADEAQRLEWRAALEAVWQDSHKRLIPVLVRNAALPPFVFGDAAGDRTQVIRLLDPRDVRGAAKAIQGALQGDRMTSSHPVDGEAPETVEVGTKADYSPKIEEARQDRIQELKKLAERLRD
jgi:TIR domain